MEIVTAKQYGQSPECDNCQKKVSIVIALETYTYIEDYNVWICKECLEKALNLINKEIENA